MDIDAIIEALGGVRQVQILLGVGPSAVSNYRTRGCFPEYARIKIWQALKARGIHLDPETLGQADEAQPESNRAGSNQANHPHQANRGGLAATSPAAPSSISKAPEARILLIISGGIAAYKVLGLIRRMREANWRVQTIMTRGAAEFITPLSVSALSEERVYGDLFSLTDEAEMGHIRLAREADAVVIAPASANIMARIAHGMADDLATTAVLATGAPILLAPAMNPFMWANPATQANLATLRGRGCGIIGPESGAMACGEEGAGRLAETPAILAAIRGILPGEGRLSGTTALVTSGPTHEPIDAVRYIANRSSGKQGHAIAAALAREGARVTLVAGPVDLPPPGGAFGGELGGASGGGLGSIRYVPVQTAREMLTASLAALPSDIAVCAAAVADWRVSEASEAGGARGAKIKKTDAAPPNLTLVENPDILATISTHKHRPRLVVGFAAESDHLLDYAAAKRAKKGCDWILANHIGTSGGGTNGGGTNGGGTSGGDGDGGETVFGSDMNEVHLITAEGSEFWPRMPKVDIALRLARAIAEEITPKMTSKINHDKGRTHG